MPKRKSSDRRRKTIIEEYKHEVVRDFQIPYDTIYSMIGERNDCHKSTVRRIVTKQKKKDSAADG